MEFPTTMAFRKVLVVGAAVATFFAASLAFASNPPSATGAGFFANSTRVFAFNAVGHSDGSATGEGALIIPGTVFFHFKVNCLQVVGNVATVTGTITDNM
jgi:hypothetical protein